MLTRIRKWYPKRTSMRIGVLLAVALFSTRVEAYLSTVWSWLVDPSIARSWLLSMEVGNSIATHTTILCMHVPEHAIGFSAGWVIGSIRGTRAWLFDVVSFAITRLAVYWLEFYLTQPPFVTDRVPIMSYVYSLMPGIAALVGGWLGARIARPYGHDRCPNCGYMVCGLPDARCPECGESVRSIPLPGESSAA